MPSRKIEENFGRVSDLQSFDKNAFIGDDKFSQETCSLILAFALIWNDHKSLALYLDHIQTTKPTDIQVENPEDMPRTPIWGEIGGVTMFIDKQLTALVHELFVLIKKSQDIIKSNEFRAIVSQMHPIYRANWNELIKVATSKTTSQSQLGNILPRTRNTIAFHYDMGEIYKGYQKKFLGNDEKPLISRGNDMSKTRYYFADGSAQDYYRSIIKTDFYKNINELRSALNSGLKGIIETFIQKRSAWRTFKDIS
jgi:hypothetical protein